ncbi:MAG: HIT family protein [Planctomycetota bacterium]|jgi:diadenosine tetraphosphate (Ap4A) HIT family hydrolase
MLARNAHAFSFYDGYPVSPGHVLVVPRRHDLDLFELTKEEQQAVFELVAEMRDFLLAEHRPDGVNVGINIGEAAGQTVGHAHVHLIPRYQGDLPDPRGGVRWVIPEKADYWSMGGGGPSNSAG